MQAQATDRAGIPFAIEGTTASPKFVPEMGGAVAGLAKGKIGNIGKGQVPVPGAKKLTKRLGGVLGKKNH